MAEDTPAFASAVDEGMTETPSQFEETQEGEGNPEYQCKCPSCGQKIEIIVAKK